MGGGRTLLVTVFVTIRNEDEIEWEEDTARARNRTNTH